jgi:predicted ATP-dependent endonuclease of OLD family
VKLRQVSITGYRSIRERLDFAVDGRVTVILGANDHGKTNVLQAITHLNQDKLFNAERDLNWDLHDRGAEFPRIEYTLTLAAAEREALLKIENAAIRRGTIREFREALEEQARQVEAARSEARAEANQSESKLAELEAVSTAEAPPDPAAPDAAAPAALAPPANAAAIPAARSELTLKQRAVEEAEQKAKLARDRVALARAEEMQIEADLNGQGPVDIVAVAEEAAAAAARASTNAKSAQTRAETAEAAKAQAAATHAADSEELTKAEQDARSAASRAEAAASAAGEAEQDANRLATIAQAVNLAREKKLAFNSEAPLPEPNLLELPGVPTEVVLSRAGIEGELKLAEPAGHDQAAVSEFVLPRLPRVELIHPQESLSDIATAETIDAAENDFMRGIFRYAGLEPDEWPGLFEQSDRTTKRLDRASEQLNKTLREAWSQGEDLGFKLDYHQGNEIHLQINDPAVDASYARASRRSSGFTHFFALKTVLYARERASNASSFIWLFDEPGIYLHPAGQHDLLQVLETLARANQAIYSTHSIFLINKNYPTRHRLLKKDKNGTGIDHKPFAGQWRAAIDALGLSFPGTVLFASKVLMVEGDSDPILINSDLQKLIELGEFNNDINSLSIMATGDSKHADALTRILLDSTVKPTIAFLFDGDKGGSDRRKNLKKMIEAKKLQQETLPKKTTGEDYVLAPELFKEATILYTQSVSGDSLKRDEIRKELEASWVAKFSSGEIKGLADWSRDEGQRVLETEEELSSVGIAREYSRLIADADPDSLPAKSRKRSIDLAEKISKMLDLPSQLAEQADVVART